LKKSSARFFLIGMICLLGFSACEQTYFPKPKAYNRIDLPEHSFQALPDTFPYSFFYSKYAELSRDSFPKAGRYFINLSYPAFDATIQITYKDLKKPENDIGKLLNDAFELTMKHASRAYSIEENLMVMPSGQVASLADISGDVPTQFQFFTTDTTTHFFRGALYFNTAEKNDSLQPIINFIKQDAVEMLNTLNWKY
jgi:gliding motility-associated lipoprotein GldD